MICAACGSAGDDAPACPACGADPLVSARWRLLDRLGLGAQGVVWRATDPRSGGQVAVKELALGRHLLAGAAAACEREARVLRELDHPGIPAFVDAFVQHRSLWVVQEFVDGESLAQERLHHRYTEAEVLALMDELLGILAYLHGLSPPVVHRDVKPGNVIRRRDGRLALVDFGSVRDRLDDAGTRAGTAAGTFGYMAPEQLRGEASPASDIYGLGALAVGLLARVEPASLLDWNHRLQWRGHVQVSAGTASLLARMVEADPRKRTSDTTKLRAEVRKLRDGRSPVKRPVLPLMAGGAGLTAMAGLWLFLPGPASPPHIPVLPSPPGESRVDLPADAPPTSDAPIEPPAPVLPAEPPVPEPTLPEPVEPTGAIGSLVRDPVTGLLYKKLGVGAVVDCAHAELHGLLTAQLSQDAAFDRYQPDFAQLGWEAGPTCRWYLAFATEVLADDLALHALVTRGSGRGRHFVVDRTGDMRELPAVGNGAIRAMLAGPLAWAGNRE